MLSIQATARDQGRRTGLVLEDEALCVFAGLNILQALAHCVLGVFGHDARAGHVLTVFGVVRDRVVHVRDAAFVDQVDDQLQLMQTLEISHLRRVARLDQRLEAGLDQLDSTAAQHGLLTEEISLGLFAEVGLDDAGTAAAVGHRV